jgi:hypothetical protein
MRMKKWLHIPVGNSPTPEVSSNRVNKSDYVKRMKLTKAKK